MTAVVLAVAALSLPHSGPPSQSQRVVVSSGDELVVPAGTNARLVSRRRAQLAIVTTPDKREAVVVVDEEKDNAPPDGLADRVYRYELEDECPDQYLFRGEGAIEEVLEIKDGDLRRAPTVVFITPTVRLRFGALMDVPDAGTAFVRSTRGQSATLMPNSPGSRAFQDVERIWLNHVENAQPGTPRTSVTLTAEPAAPVTPQARTGAESTVPVAPDAPDSPPRLLVQAKPSYTADAMRRKVQGRVVLQVTVEADGTVSDAVVAAPLDPDLDAEAVKAVRKWRFAPAMRSGRPVAATVPVEMAFTLAPQ
jgi:TonB family protein